MRHAICGMPESTRVGAPTRWASMRMCWINGGSSTTSHSCCTSAKRVPPMKAPRSLLRGIKTQNLQPSKQLHLDVLTMQLLIRLFAALLLDILAYDFFIAMTPYGTDKVTFGPEFSAP